MREKVLFLINPMAGRQRMKYELMDVLDALTKAGYETTAFTTQGSEKTAELLREAEGKYKTIICSGGDGTFNEILGNTLQWKEKPYLGYIPCGTTNDFASGLGIPTKIQDAVMNIINGTPHELDAGKFEENHFFSYVASFGAFTETSYSTPQSMKNAFGHAAYILNSFKELPAITPIKVHLEFNGQVYDDEFVFGSVTNARSIGGVVRLSKECVNFSDGLFEIMMVKLPKTIFDLSIILNSINTMKYDPRMIVFAQTSDLIVETDQDLVWTLDGERVDGGTKAHISCIHNGFSLLTCDEKDQF